MPINTMEPTESMNEIVTHEGGVKTAIVRDVLAGISNDVRKIVFNGVDVEKYAEQMVAIIDSCDILALSIRSGSVSSLNKLFNLIPLHKITRLSIYNMIVRDTYEAKAIINDVFGFLHTNKNITQLRLQLSSLHHFLYQFPTHLTSITLSRNHFHNDAVPGIVKLLTSHTLIQIDLSGNQAIRDWKDILDAVQPQLRVFKANGCLNTTEIAKHRIFADFIIKNNTLRILHIRTFGTRYSHLYLTAMQNNNTLIELYISGDRYIPYEKMIESKYDMDNAMYILLEILKKVSHNKQRFDDECSKYMKNAEYITCLYSPGDVSKITSHKQILKIIRDYVVAQNPYKLFNF